MGLDFGLAFTFALATAARIFGGILPTVCLVNAFTLEKPFAQELVDRLQAVRCDLLCKIVARENPQK